MMKSLFSILLCTITLSLFAQDIIVKKNGEEIRSKVIEITETTIKYKEFDFQDGPLRNIGLRDVFMIIYDNGRRENFVAQGAASPAKQAAEASADGEAVAPGEDRNFKGTHFMVGPGVGTSYGGAGLRAQMRFGGQMGFGVHAGVGLSPDVWFDPFGETPHNELPILGSVGLKFYPFKGVYIGSQVGLVGTEYNYYYYYDDPIPLYNDPYTEPYPYDDYYYPYYEDYTVTYLIGQSFMSGVDWTWGSKVGFGFNAGLGFMYVFNTSSYFNVRPAADLGFVLRF